MRISTDQQYRNLQESIGRSEARIAALQAQISSGRRIKRPSDDPVAAIGAMSFRVAKSLTEQQLKNAAVGQDNMKQSEAALGEMAELLKRANTLALAGANAATPQEGRDVMVAELKNMKDRLLALANSKGLDGSYLFAGYEVSTEPFVPNPAPPGPPIVYQGDAGKQFLDVGPGVALEGNMLIDQMVLRAYDALEDVGNRLAAGDLSGLSGVSLQLIEDSSKELRLARGDAGARTRAFVEASDTAQRRADEFTANISLREDADLTEVVVELQLAQTTYQAALTAFNSSQGITLLDYLR